MSYCSNCGENIGDSNFCGVCGEKKFKTRFSNLESKENINIIESRDIEKYLNHLKNLIKSKNSVLNQDDLLLYEKTLRSLSESKFKKLYLPKFVGMKKVKDINDYLGIEDDITNKQLGRPYKGVNFRVNQMFPKTILKRNHGIKNGGVFSLYYGF